MGDLKHMQDRIKILKKFLATIIVDTWKLRSSTSARLQSSTVRDNNHPDLKTYSSAHGDSNLCTWRRP